jgi:hypothetical protein
MRTLIRFKPGDVMAGRPDAFRRLGMSGECGVSERLEELCRKADTTFITVARPTALFSEISVGEFESIYEGAGANAPETPLDVIYPRADALALFAATLGSAVDEAIRALFQHGDPALGFVLDVIASGAADRLAHVTVQPFLTALRESGRGSPHTRALAYSPGYCGWHVSGQRALFDALDPRSIGVGLTASCLMDPIKSVSGVLIAGRSEIHRFRPTFPFCDACATHDCRVRMASLKEPRR